MHHLNAYWITGLLLPPVSFMRIGLLLRGNKQTTTKKKTWLDNMHWIFFSWENRLFFLYFFTVIPLGGLIYIMALMIFQATKWKILYSLQFNNTTKLCVFILLLNHLFYYLNNRIEYLTWCSRCMYNKYLKIYLKDNDCCQNVF